MTGRTYNDREAHEEIKCLQARLSATQKINQDNVENALEWRRKYLEADEKHHEATTRIVALEQVNQHNITRGLELYNQLTTATAQALDYDAQARSLRAQLHDSHQSGLAADHCVGALRAELEEKQRALDTALAYGAPDVAKLREENARLSQRVKMLQNSEASTIRSLTGEVKVARHALEEARKRADVVKANYADAALAYASLRVEIHRKDKDLQLLRSELERGERQRTSGVGFSHTATEVDEAFNRGRAQGRSEGVGDYARGLRDGQARQCKRLDIALAHRGCSADFLNRAIDLQDLLHEISEEDPHAVKFKVSNPAMTGSIVALTHALRDFHNTPCQSNEG